MGDAENFLLVKAMEAWFLANGENVVVFWGQLATTKNVPGDERHMGEIPKRDLEHHPGARYSRHTEGPIPQDPTSGFALLGVMEAPLKVQMGSPHAHAFHRVSGCME